MDKKTKILITGGRGFLGSSLIEKLHSKEYWQIITFSSSEYDLTNKNSVEELFATYNPEVVIHLAAKVGGIGANQRNPGKFAYDNLAMGMNIIETCRQHEIRKLVIAATICGYPKFTPIPFKEEDIWNGFPSNFPEISNAPYGLAKRMLLVLAQAYRQQYDLNSIVLFPVNLYGIGDHFDLEDGHVIPVMIRKFHEAKLNNTDVTLWGDGTPTREFLYVDDCAEAFVKAMEKYDGPDPINIGSGKEISILDLATKIQSVVGHQGKIIWDKTKPNGQPRRCLDVTRAKKWLGWEAKTNFDEGLKKTYQWFQNIKVEEETI